MLAFVTTLSEHSQSVRAAIQQMIIFGIEFQGWKEQSLSPEIPEKLNDFEGCIITGERFKTLTPAEQKKLENYARTHYVSVIPENLESATDLGCEFASEIDVQFFLSAGGFKRGKMPVVPSEKIYHGYFKVMEESFRIIETVPRLFEYHLHCLESLLESEKAGILPPEWSERITNKINDMEKLFVTPGDMDELAGFFVAPISVERCGHHRILDRALAAADEVVTRWNRSDLGLLSMGGFKDDPLLFKNLQSQYFACSKGNNSARDIHLNEQLHYFGAAFPALSEASGDPRFLAETVALMKHVDKVHRDPKDNLLFHASLHGKPLGAKWGRGTTHALLGVFYLLKFTKTLPQEIRQYAIDFLDRTGQALMKYQTVNGVWRNVIDCEDTPEETSCSVLITWIYAYGINHGWFPKERYRDMVVRSGEALKRRFWCGCGSSNCRGSLPSADPGYYRRRPIHMYMMPLIAPALIESDKLR